VTRRKKVIQFYTGKGAHQRSMRYTVVQEDMTHAAARKLAVRLRKEGYRVRIWTRSYISRNNWYVAAAGMRERKPRRGMDI
jgi:hypothetical protein